MMLMIISTLEWILGSALFVLGDAHGQILAEISVGIGSVSEPAPESRFIRETGAAVTIAELAEPVLESLGFRVVLVRIMGGQGPIIEILAERPDGTMSIEDCRSVSLDLSPLLDVHDPMPGQSYRLQVSSPGIDRPLVRLSDFDTWAGYEAKIEMKELISGRRRFRGIIEGFEGTEVRLDVELPDVGRQTIGLPVSLIAEAKLVLTDDLVRESLRRSKKAKMTEAASPPPTEAEAQMQPTPVASPAAGGQPKGQQRASSKAKPAPVASPAAGGQPKGQQRAHPKAQTKKPSGKKG